MEVSLNYCSQSGGNVYRAPYYNRNLNIGPLIDSNLGQSPYGNLRSSVSSGEGNYTQLIHIDTSGRGIEGYLVVEDEMLIILIIT